MKNLQIQPVEREGGGWPALQALVERLDQVEWMDFRAPWQVSEHVLLALEAGEGCGFLRYVVQPIGPELDRPAFEQAGTPLLEAKVLAFGVLPEQRRKGVGRALQERLIEQARGQGLFQIRSHSGGENVENHRLKLALGYAVVPILRGEDRNGAYFVLPLRGGER